MYRVAMGDEALVRHGGGRSIPKVTFSGGMLVLPWVHRIQRVSVAIRHIPAACSGREAAITLDGRRQEITGVFAVRVNKTQQGVLESLSAYGYQALCDDELLGRQLLPRFVEALRIGVSQFDSASLPSSDVRLRLKETVVMLVGMDLNGLILEDLHLEY